MGHVKIRIPLELDLATPRTNNSWKVRDSVIHDYFPIKHKKGRGLSSPPQKARVPKLVAFT